MRHSYRNRFGQFAPVPANRKIVNGRLYGYKGTVVRAGIPAPNGQRWVSFHNKLNGLVNDSELRFVGKTEVKNYLQAK